MKLSVLIRPIKAYKSLFIYYQFLILPYFDLIHFPFYNIDILLLYYLKTGSDSNQTTWIRFEPNHSDPGPQCCFRRAKILFETWEMHFQIRSQARHRVNEAWNCTSGLTPAIDV